jgi:hypothetical protein
MTTLRNRLITAVVVALTFSSAPIAMADTDPFPGVALGAEVGPRQAVSPSTGNPLDGSAIITCPTGAGLGAFAGSGGNYVACTKTWRPQVEIDADATFQQAQRDATAAAETLSREWNAAHPGLQKCFQWGPIVHANGVSTASGGVCANPVPAPSGSSDSGTVQSPAPLSVQETSTPTPSSSPSQSPAPVNTNGFGGYAVVHPDGHVCGVIVSGSSDPFNNGGVMPNEYMGCPPGSRIVFQSAPSADGNVAGWHGPDVVLNGNTYTLPGGSTINGGIVTDSNGRTWNSGTGQTITPGIQETRTVLSDTRTVLSDTNTVVVDSSTVIAAQLALPLTVGSGGGVTANDDLDALPEITAEEEVNNSIDARIINNKTRIEVSTEWVSSKLTIVATKKGSKKKFTYRITTDSDGNYLFKSSVNLKGFTLILLKGSEELTREIV